MTPPTSPKATATTTNARSSSRPRPIPPKPAPDRSIRRTRPTGSEGIQARRFDADRRDTILSFEEALKVNPADRQLLWIDIQGSLDEAQADALAKRFKLDQQTRSALERIGSRPHLGLHGEYFHLRVAAEPGQGKSPSWLDAVAGRNVVLSRHDSALAFLDTIHEQVQADAAVGQLSSATFVAFLLDGVLTSYFKAVDGIEDDVDELDARSLQGRQAPELLDDLVRLRRQIAELRRLLASHREVFSALGDTGALQVVDDPDAADALHAVSERFDDAMGAVEDAREVLIGSFDVLMTRTAQRTNEIMKILALATVLLLPGSLLAGLLGMNVSIPLSKDDPMSFWVVIGIVVALAALIIGVGRLRRWL